MYPTRTPPAHLQGDPGQARLLDGLAVFVIGTAASAALTIYALRLFGSHINSDWARVPFLHFAQVFVPALFKTNDTLWFGIGALILIAGVTGIGLAAWAGIASGRAIGGAYGVRYIAGPVLQIAPPPRADHKNGIVIARGIRFDMRQECRGVKVTGSTGSGKTTVIAPLIIQAVARMDRVVIWDEKAGFVETLRDITILSPWDRRAVRWALSVDLRDKSTVQDFANHVCPSPATGDSIWAKAAAAIVIACSIGLSETQGRWFLSDLRRKILAVSIDLNVLQKEVQTHYPEASGIVADLKSKALSSVIFQLSASLQSVLMLGEMDEELAKLDRKPFSLSAYLSPTKPGEPLIPTPPVLLPGHPTAPELSAAFCGAIIHYISTNLAGRPDTPADRDQTWLFLDEFPQIGRQNGVIRLLEVGRSKSVRVVIGIQGPEQIQRVYGHDHVLKTILNNTLTKFHFQYLDHDAAEWASNSLGKSYWKVRRASHSTGGNGGQNVSWQDVESPVYQPSDFMSKLGPRESTKSVYCIIAGLFPDPILSRHPFLSDPKLRPARDMIEILVPRPLQIAAAVPDAAAADSGDCDSGDDTVINPFASAPSKRTQTEPARNADADAHDRPAPPVLTPVYLQVAAVSSAQKDENEGLGDEAEWKLIDSAFTSALDVVAPGVGMALDFISEVNEITDTALPITPMPVPVPVPVLPAELQLTLYEWLKLAKKRREQENEGEME